MSSISFDIRNFYLVGKVDLDQRAYQQLNGIKWLVSVTRWVVGTDCHASILSRKLEGFPFYHPAKLLKWSGFKKIYNGHSMQAPGKITGWWKGSILVNKWISGCWFGRNTANANKHDIFIYSSIWKKSDGRSLFPTKQILGCASICTNACPSLQFPCP